MKNLSFKKKHLPKKYCSLYTTIKEIMKRQEAVYIAGKGLSREYLIKAVAQQMGSAHEDEGIEPVLVELGDIFINGVQPYISIRAKQFHAITNGEPQDEGILHDIGWLHANELKHEEITKGYEEFIYRNFLLLYGKLLSPRDTLETEHFALRSDCYMQ